MIAEENAWQTLGDLTPADLVAPALELHWAAQLVAAAGQNFGDPAADDSHRAMVWNADRRALVGARFAGPYPFRMSLRPSDLTLQMLDRPGDALGSLPLAGLTLDDAYAWLASGVATYLGGALPLIERPEYEMPSHPLAKGARFSEGDAEWRVLSALYGSAAALLEEVARRPGAGPVRCWPHHFDIATLLALGPGPAGERTVGVGMAPAGGGLPEWYWYVSPWPRPEPTSLPPLPGPGAWHTDGWVGAVLPGAEVIATPGARRASLVRSFIDEAVDATVRVLSP